MAIREGMMRGAQHVFVEPAKADPQDIGRRREAAPQLRMPPDLEWVVGPDGKVVDIEQEGMTFRRKTRNYFGELLYNMLVTYIPFHSIRLGYLRLFGAKIGKGSSIMRTTTVLDIEFLTIGEDTTVGNRCFLDARGGIYLGDNVTIASDVHIIGASHDMDHPDFPPIIGPTVVEDYAWIASRAMILPSLIGRGAVVAAQALVVNDVGELEVVGGVPAKVFAKRNPDALQYSARYRPLFG
jgi:acetyltransferase-like isoleucine patch superfamily enzyme